MLAAQLLSGALLLHFILSLHSLPLPDGKASHRYKATAAWSQKTHHYGLKKRGRLPHIQDTVKEPDIKSGHTWTALSKNGTDFWKRPRCGVPDYPTQKGASAQDYGHKGTMRGGHHRQKRFVLYGGRWEKTDLTYKIVRTPWQMSLDKVRSVLQEAMQVWSDVTPLTFTEVTSGRADIVIDFTRYWHGDNLPFDGPGGILAHAFFPRTYREGDIHFDYDETWTVGNSMGTDLLQVAAHEIGHVLGLQHSLAPGSVMSPFYSFSYPLQLSEDDKRGIQYLYGARQSNDREQEKERQRELERKRELERQRELEREQERKRERERERERELEQERERARERELEQERERARERELEQERKRARERELELEREREREREWEREQERARERERQWKWEREQERQREREREQERQWEQERDRQRQQELERAIRPPAISETNEIFSTVPDVCHTDFDAVSMIRGELFFFKSGYVWRIRDGQLQAGYPALASRHWRGIPDHIDAAFEDRSGNIWFLQGQSYLVFDAERQIAGPDSIQRLGLSVLDIQAALMWGEDKAQKVYFFKEGSYWRFNTQENRVDTAHPRSMQDWRGIPNDIDAAFQDRYGYAHFLKGQQYWKFDPVKVKALEGYPRYIGMDFFGCSPSMYR
ncbi:stromelysin-3 [Chanos chanos]|uniref:Stromelysin-3 n=1 Tax=Chanos chanos TaxID=29144 RepID=A0A6J2UYJ9_CHACN|nr:stromelysin-3-like [Chanos chanos]